jgi:transposase
VVPQQVELGFQGLGHLQRGGDLQLPGRGRVRLGGRPQRGHALPGAQRALGQGRGALGDGRFSSSRKAVRFAGLDVTVRSSDRKGPPGRLSRQGPPVLRFSSALAVSGCTRVAIDLRCREADPSDKFRDKRQRGRGSPAA